MFNSCTRVLREEIMNREDFISTCEVKGVVCNANLMLSTHTMGLIGPKITPFDCFSGSWVLILTYDFKMHLCL